MSFFGTYPVVFDISLLPKCVFVLFVRFLAMLTVAFVFWFEGTILSYV